jgi:two-component system, response regulator YesN
MKQVLVIEDDCTLRTVYKEILSSNGYSVKTAENGREGLEILKKLQPDVILLDILMPMMNGLTFLEKSNIKETYPDTTVIAFSNLSDIDMLNKMLELGADTHMLKSSISPKELLRTVSDACRGKVRQYNLHTA